MTTADTAVLPEVEDSPVEQREKLYHLIMLNDEDHTYEYVIEMLQNIFGFSQAIAVRHTMEADTTGSTILITCGLAEAEGKRDRIHAYGPDWRLPHSRGSVTALVEPA
jgi:ATP-dependent Clp protease adaptor protein ClpS